MALPKEPVSRKLKSAVLLSVAITLGLFAHRLNDQEAELRWRREHRPTLEIWRAGWAPLGFREITNPAQSARLAKSLPTLTDGTGHVWYSDPDWWAVEQSDGNPPAIFCLKCDLRAVPKGWNTVGSGWEAWESAMGRSRTLAQAEQERRIRANSAKKAPERADPREIRY